MNEQMVDKIRKLLALSQSPNEHEVALALQRARELMERYGVTASDLEERVCEQRLPAGSVSGYERLYAGFILREFFHARIVHVTGTRTVLIVGYPHHVQIGIHVFQFLIRTYARLWEQYREKALSKTWKRYKLANRQAIHRTYVRGLSFGLEYKLRNKPVKDQQGLIIAHDDTHLDEYMTARKFTTTSVVATPHNQGTYEAGIAAGLEINIHPAVAKNKPGTKQLRAGGE